MAAYEYFVRQVPITWRGELDWTAILRVKEEGGLTAWEHVQEYGRQGWELVSVVPLAESLEPGQTRTTELLFFFKRELLSES